MKIYFAGSIRGGQNDFSIYADMIEYLKKFGEVLTEHIGNKELLNQERIMTNKEIHDRDMNWIVKSDVVVAEVTNPSLGVGYELGRAIEMKKKILCLFRVTSDKSLSAMIAGSDNVTNKNYKSIDEAKKMIDLYFESALEFF